MILGPHQPGPRPLLFDLGETLIHFGGQNAMPDIKQGTRGAHQHLLDLGLVPPSLRRYRACCQRWFMIDFVSALIRRREVDVLQTLAKVHRALHLPTDHGLLVRLCGRIYEPQRNTARPAPDAHAVLQTLKDRGHPLAIVSNTMVPGEVLDEHLESENLLSYFDTRVYSSEVGFKKPHARIFRAALMGLNVKPQGCVFVGDKLALDVKGAQRLGMIAVLKRERPGRQWPYRADYHIRQLSELPAIVETLGPSEHHPALVPAAS